MMPVVQINLVEGRSDEAVQRCVKAVARAVHETLGAPLPTIRVFVNQIPPQHWAVGDRTRQEIDREKEESDAAVLRGERI
jgi:4-oxalocrotonate tautomerase